MLQTDHSSTLRTKIPPDLIWRTLLITMVGIFIAIANIVYGQGLPDLRSATFTLATIIGFLGLTALDWHVRRGYRVWYDENFLHQREASMLWSRAKVHSIPLQDVDELTGDDVSLMSGNLRAAVVTATTGDDEVTLALDYLAREDLNETLAFLANLPNVRVHQVVSDYLARQS